jgi:outer membrane protein
MIRRGSRVALISGALALVAATSPAWADMKIGVVNFQALLQQSPEAKAASEAMQSEFGPRQKQLVAEQAALKARGDALQKDEITMTPDARENAEKALRDSTREFQMRYQQFQDDANAWQNQENTKLQKALVEQVGSYARAQQYDLVVGIGVLYANPALDITQQVLQAMQAARPATAAPHSSGTTTPKSSGSAGK